LTVNVKKSKTMILQNNCVKPLNYFVKFKDDFLENVKEYKYLGCMINSYGSLVNSSFDLSKKVKVAYNLFDTLVKPILTYNSEISFMDSYLKLFTCKKK